MKTFLFRVADWYMEADDLSIHLGASDPQNDPEAQVPAQLGCSWKCQSAGGAALCVKTATSHVEVSADMLFKWLEV